MEKGNNKKFYRLHWLLNIIRHGLIFQGIRNKLARFGLDFMPYFWTLEGEEEIICPKVKGDTSGFVISNFTELDVERAQDLIAGNHYKNLTSFIKEGQVCVGIKDNEAIVAFMFIKKEFYLFRGKTFRFQEYEAYLHSMYTFETYRGRRIAPYLRYHCYEICKELNLTRVYSISEYLNKSSRKFKKKLKAKHTKLYLSLVLFKRYKKTILLKRYV